VKNAELIKTTARLLNPHKVDDRTFGNVAATIVTDKGNLYSGVCIDTGSGTGFCAEAAAIASMVTAREYKIRKVIAVWKDSAGTVHAVPPCGRCREFIRQIDDSNLEAEIVLGRNESARLEELLPHHDWPKTRSASRKRRNVSERS